MAAGPQGKQTLTGWAMASPAFLLMLLFLITPFFLAFGLSLTNQRLISPNPAEYVGARNFENLLGLSFFVLEPERD
ncbi:MAG: sugar ABC transporter permease, partial [Pseudomonadota bacterium]